MTSRDRVPGVRGGGAGARALLLAGALAAVSLAALVGIPGAASAYVPRAPILIVGDAAFTPDNGVTGGSGTPSDPYIIEGWDIDASAADGIAILYTTAHFVVRNVRVHSGFWNYVGVWLEGVQNGRIEGSVFADNADGVYVLNSADVTLTSNTITGSLWDGDREPAVGQRLGLRRVGDFAPRRPRERGRTEHFRCGRRHGWHEPHVRPEHVRGHWRRPNDGRRDEHARVPQRIPRERDPGGGRPGRERVGRWLPERGQLLVRLRGRGQLQRAEPERVPRPGRHRRHALCDRRGQPGPVSPHVTCARHDCESRSDPWNGCPRHAPADRRTGDDAGRRAGLRTGGAPADAGGS